MSRSNIANIDWISILIYLLLVSVGWVCIYATNFNAETTQLVNISEFHTKQMVFIGMSLLMIVAILSLEVKFYERFSAVFYILCIVLLVGLFFFGKKINGARAWYGIGGITLQPAEFAKIATSLLLAKYLTTIQVDVRQTKYLFKSILIIAFPAALIMLQPDPGSVLVYASLVLVLNREGMKSWYLLALFYLAILFIFTLKIGFFYTILFCGFGVMAYVFFHKRKKKRVSYFPLIVLWISSAMVSGSATYVYDNVLKQHHRDRISLWLRLDNNITQNENLKKTIGYNSKQSESAISSGGLWGKGFLEGTRTKGGFVPEQHTDYIFTTLSEEWGFAGASLVILLFVALLLRIWYLSEQQLNKFTRIYGYCVLAIFFSHFVINIGMVIGLLPTIGIPLPFFSYGGSGLLAFTMLLFIFLKLDTSKSVRWE